MGAFAVYRWTAAGWDSSLQLSDVHVHFDSLISEADRGQQVQIALSLNRATQDRVTVDVVPLAGDAQNGTDFAMDAGQTVTFEPGETTKVLTIRIVGSSEHDELVALGLANAVCAQPGARNLRLLRIKAG